MPGDEKGKNIFEVAADKFADVFSGRVQKEGTANQQQSAQRFEEQERPPQEQEREQEQQKPGQEKEEDQNYLVNLIMKILEALLGIKDKENQQGGQQQGGSNQSLDEMLEKMMNNSFFKKMLSSEQGSDLAVSVLKALEKDHKDLFEKMKGAAKEGEELGKDEKGDLEKVIEVETVREKGEEKGKDKDRQNEKDKMLDQSDDKARQNDPTALPDIEKKGGKER